MDAFPLQTPLHKVLCATERTRQVPSVVLTGHGGLGNIKVMDTPLPNSLQFNHVEVEVAYFGLNFTDNYLRLGIIRSETFPIIMGSECCGVVSRVGAGVKDLEVGQRVVCLDVQGGLFRRTVHARRAAVFPLPPHISFRAAIALALDFLVAHVCLFQLAQLRKGAVVFMQSLAGGVGTVVAQLARVVPLVTVLGTAAEEKHDRLWRLGVQRAFRHRDGYPRHVRALYPEGADVVIVRGGGADTDKCLGLLKPCGRLITIGSDSTATYPRTLTMTLQRPTWDTRYLSSAQLINKNVVVSGLNIGDLIDNHPEDVQMIMNSMFDMHYQEKIVAQVHCIVPFEKTAEGLQLLCARRNFGKVVVQARDDADPALLPRAPLPPLLPPDAERTRSELAVRCKRRVRSWLRQAAVAAEAGPRLDEGGSDAEGSDPALDDSMVAELAAASASSESELQAGESATS